MWTHHSVMCSSGNSWQLIIFLAHIHKWKWLYLKAGTSHTNFNINFQKGNNPWKSVVFYCFWERTYLTQQSVQSLRIKFITCHNLKNEICEMYSICNNTFDLLTCKCFKLSQKVESLFSRKHYFTLEEVHIQDLAHTV